MLPKCQNVIKSMTGNTHFPDPSPTMDELAKGVTEFSDALVKMQNGTPIDAIIKKQKRQILESLMNRLGIYVQLKGNNDPAIIGSSGFELPKERTPLGPLPQPEHLKVVPIRGGAKLSVKTVVGARSYTFEYTPTPVSEESVWKMKIVSPSNVVLDGLVSGKEYAFRVFAIGTVPTINYSHIVTSFIL